MSASSESIVQLPNFVRKQAEQALMGLAVQPADGICLTGRLFKTAILIEQEQPHPLTGEVVRLPVALVNWRDDRWQLYFRGTRGRWLGCPGAGAERRPGPLLAAVAEDQLGIFWRQ